nr:zinc finger FYVE domain-containing protein 1-like [Cherax quadricarinatus]
MEPRRGAFISGGPGVAHSIRIEGSAGLSRIPPSLSVASSAPTPSSAIMSSLASYTSEANYDNSFNSLLSLRKSVNFCHPNADAKLKLAQNTLHNHGLSACIHPFLCKQCIVLAVSDVIIYRTRSERLNTDMYKFLAEASRAYTKYFRADLEAVARKAECDCVFGPPVFIFHDTRHTSVLKEGTVAFQPHGTVTFYLVIKLFSNHVQTINKKFSGQIQSTEPAFPDEYFTCTSVCAACQARCCLFMNHATHDNGSKDHEAERQCKYHHQFENKVFLCRKCDSEGERRIVIPKTSSAKDSTWLGLAKYAWAGYVLECEKCGIIYRSRQYWYGNESPDRCEVKEEYQHVWSGTVVGGAAHAGRQVCALILGGVLGLSFPNVLALQHCKMCQEPLDTIHHCRKCGEGFCDGCSDVKMAVPELGWGEEPVRVCKNCFKARTNHSVGSEDYDCSTDEQTVIVRQVSEVISGTLASVAKYPIEFLKDSARPSYWTPDEIITTCIVCEKEFGPRLTLHHCRACGQGVCDKCSPNLRPVKERGWDHPVRVCNNCLK